MEIDGKVKNGLPFIEFELAGLFEPIELVVDTFCHFGIIIEIPEIIDRLRANNDLNFLGVTAPVSLGGGLISYFSWYELPTYVDGRPENISIYIPTIRGRGSKCCYAGYEFLVGHTLEICYSNIYPSSNSTVKIRNVID